MITLLPWILTITLIPYAYCILQLILGDFEIKEEIKFPITSREGKPWSWGWDKTFNHLKRTQAVDDYEAKLKPNQPS